jgi:hypothetical protein
MERPERVTGTDSLVGCLRRQAGLRLVNLDKRLQLGVEPCDPPQTRIDDIHR